MNREQIEAFVLRYLDATGCRIVEKGDGHVTVRLSPEADKDLMNRSYYWSFVERTGADPEPMSFTFVFDPEARAKSMPAPGGRQPVKAGQGMVPAPGQPGGAAPPGAAAIPAGPWAGPGLQPAAAPSPAGEGPAPQGAQPPAAAGDSILGRYFGFVPTGAVSRIPSDVMMFGSRRLEQLFGVVQARGRFVRLFEEPKEAANPFASIGYSTWLGINYKVEFICDMKREEIHSFGIHLGTGQIADRFYEQIKRKPLSPKLPPSIHLQPVALPLSSAVELLELHLENRVKGYDHRWSEEAWQRLREERKRIDAYFDELLKAVEPDKRAEVEEQYKSRDQELEWQYSPRIAVSVINCGFFHLAEGIRTAIDANR